MCFNFLILRSSLFLFFGFSGISQIEFLCEPIDPCTPKNDAQVCAPSGPPCVTEMINASSQHTRSEGWYLCKTEMDLQLLYNNTLQSGEIVVYYDFMSEYYCCMFIVYKVITVCMLYIS